MLPQYDEGVAVIMSDLAGGSPSSSQQYPTTTAPYLFTLFAAFSPLKALI